MKGRHKASILAVCIAVVVASVGAVCYLLCGDLEPGVTTLRFNAPTAGILYIEVKTPSTMLLGVEQHITARAVRDIGSTASCDQPLIRVQFWGAALLPVEFDQALKGSITFAIPGTYHLHVHLLLCGSTAVMNSNASLASFVVAAGRTPAPMIDPATAVWAFAPRCADGSRSAKCTQSKEAVQPPWHPPGLQENLAWLQISSGGALVYDPRTFVDTKHASSTIVTQMLSPAGFDTLSNYELLCFVGDNQARLQLLAVKALLRPMQSTQRPFKFWYMNVTDVQTPASGWDQGVHRQIRKCKMVVLSIAGIKPATGAGSLVTGQAFLLMKFLCHIARMINDSTFPIWMMSASHDPSGRYSPRSTDQFNNMLGRIFDPMHQGWQPKGLMFMDNRDLTAPISEFAAPGSANELMNNWYETHVSRITTIRIMQAVGKHVQWWRRDKQMGTRRGLSRNGVMTPDPEYNVMYNFHDQELKDLEGFRNSPHTCSYTSLSVHYEKMRVA